MGFFEIVQIARTFMWFGLSWLLWFGLRDYLASRYERTTRRWKIARVVLAGIILINFFVFGYILMGVLGFTDVEASFRH